MSLLNRLLRVQIANIKKLKQCQLMLANGITNANHVIHCFARYPVIVVYFVRMARFPVHLSNEVSRAVSEYTM